MISPRAILLVTASAVALAFGGAGSAAAHEFHSEISPTLLQAEEVGTHVFENTSNEAKIVCGEALLQGTTTATQVSEFAVSPYYAECTYGSTVTIVKMNGCQYQFFGETNGSGEAEIKIDCPAGKKMEIEVGSLCTAKVTPMTVWGVKYANKGSGTSRDFQISMELREVLYEKVGLFCKSIFGNGSDMRFTGTFTVRGYEGGVPLNQRGIWVE